jgi:hypothetical protein
LINQSISDKKRGRGKKYIMMTTLDIFVYLSIVGFGVLLYSLDCVWETIGEFTANVKDAMNDHDKPLYGRLLGFNRRLARVVYEV